MATHAHKVFVSYHHENDQYYRDKFEKILTQSGISIIKSVQMGDLDPELKTETIRQKIRDGYLRDSTVTVVLVGKDTWRRKHVDWEIGSTIRDTQLNPRGGLLGIILPTYVRSDPSKYNSNTIPPRLYDNIQRKYAKIYNWNEDPNYIRNWIHSAFNVRTEVIPDNSYPSFANNRAGDQWQ